MTDIYPRKAANLASRLLNGEAIVMNPVDSTLFNLNETATAIWLAADGRTSLREIVERDVCPQFEIDREEAMRDAEEFVRTLAQHSIFFLETEPPVHSETTRDE